MPVLVTNKSDKDPIKNETASLETPFSHYKCMGNFSDAQGHLTLSGVVRSGPNSNLSEILCLSLLPASLKKSDKKQHRKGGDIVFPIISQWVVSVALETRVLIQSAPKLYATFPPP